LIPPNKPEKYSDTELIFFITIN